MKLTQGQISEMISDLTKNKESFSLLMSKILNSLMTRGSLANTSRSCLSSRAPASNL